MAKTSAKRSTSTAKKPEPAKREPAKKAETKQEQAKPTIPRIGTPRYPDTAKIVVLPKGKENPRRQGSPPYQRYAVLLKSKTVGEFLKELPEWRATIARAVKEQRIEVKE